MTNHKIIFSGPVGAGKTTAISAISDIPPVVTDELASDMTQSRKGNTTVAMDYGMMKLGDGERIHLYGTPGQERFDFMWDILCKGGLGLILLINNSQPKPFQDLEFFLTAFRDFIDRTYVAIGVTRMDLSNCPTINDYHQHLGQMGMKVPVFDVDARDRKDVTILVESLLLSMDPVMVT